MPAPINPGLSDEPVSPSDNPCLPFEQDETAFYEALKADDQRAWNCLYIRVTASFVPYACQRSAINIEDAYDMMQEGLAEFAIKLRDGRFIFQGRPVAAYVFVVCRNRWASFLKKQKLARLEPYQESMAGNKSGEADYEPTPVFSLTPAEDVMTTESAVADLIWGQSEVDWEAVGQAFGELNDDCRTLLHCFYVDGLSLKACGERMGLQENSAKVKRFRCAQRLRMLYMNYRKDD